MKILFRRYGGGVLFLTVLVIFVLGMADRNFYIGGDLTIPLSPKQNMEKMYLWANGQESFSFCAPLLFSYYTVLEKVGITANVSQKILILVGFAGQFIFMYKLFLLLFGKGSDESRKLMAYFAATAYALNPAYFLVVNGYLPLLGFPLATYILVLYMKGGGIIRALTFSLALDFFFLSDMPQPKMTLVFILAAIFTVYIFRHTQNISVKQVIKRTAALALVCTITNLWILVPLVQSALYGDVGVFTKDVARQNGMADFALADIYYIGRFFNRNIVDYYPKLSKFLVSPVFILYTLGLWLLLTAGTYKVLSRRDGRRVLASLYLALLFFIVLAKGPNPPLGWIYRLFVIYVPFASVFRTTSSIAVAATFFFSLGLPFAVKELLSNATPRKTTFVFSALIVTNILVFLPIPLGFKFFNQYGSLPNQKGYTIPDDYFKVNDILAKLDDDYKILSLPMVNGYVKKDWGYFGPDIASWITDRTDYFRVNDYGLSLNKQDTLFTQPKSYVTREWNNIGYILLQKDTVGGFLPEPNNFINRELVFNGKYLALYKLKNESFSSRTEIRTTSQYVKISGNVDRLSDAKELVSDNGLQDFVIVDKQSAEGPLYTIAKEMQQTITDAPEWNRGWSWPNATTNPKNILYILPEIHEWVAEHTATKPESKYDLLLWHASKRLEEINAYDLDAVTLEANLDKYDKKVATLISALDTVTKKDRNKNYWEFVQKAVAYARKGYQTLEERDPKVDLVYLNRVRDTYMRVWDWIKKNADYYGCKDFCYKLDIVAEGEYTILSNDPRANKVDVDQLGTFPLHAETDSSWTHTDPINLKKQRYSTKLVYEKEDSLANGLSWTRFNGTTETPELLFGTVDTNIKLGKEKLHISNTSDAYYYLPIDPWETGTTYRISFDYNTGQGILKTVVIYQPKITIESVWHGEEKPREPQYVIQFSNELSYSGDSNVGCDYKEEGACYAHTEFSFVPDAAGKNGKLVITGASSNKLTFFYPVGVRNVKITKVKPATIVAYSDLNTKPALITSSPSSVISYEKTDPTKYRVKLVNPNKDSYLVLNENFGEWRVYVSDGTNSSRSLPKRLETLFLPSIPESDHFTINGFANAWKIRSIQPGSAKELDLVVEYFPQKVFYIALLVSLLSVVLLLAVSGVYNLRKAGK